jgi:hypothetical protein
MPPGVERCLEVFIDLSFVIRHLPLAWKRLNGLQYRFCQNGGNGK